MRKCTAVNAVKAIITPSTQTTGMGITFCSTYSYNLPFFLLAWVRLTGTPRLRMFLWGLGMMCFSLPLRLTWMSFERGFVGTSDSVHFTGINVYKSQEHKDELVVMTVGTLMWLLGLKDLLIARSSVEDIWWKSGAQRAVQWHWLVC